MKFPRYQRGVFTSVVGNVALQYVRDEEGLKLLNNRQRNLTFIGSDKFAELTLSGALTDTSVVDKVPIRCSMVLAGKPDENVGAYMRLGRPMTVATSYPYVLSEVLKSSPVDLRPMYVEGGCEGYVASGLADLSFDIKSSGDTVTQNGLAIYQETPALTLNVLDSCSYDKRSTGDRLLDDLRAIAETLTARCAQVDVNELESTTLTLMRSPNNRVKKLFEEFGELVQALQRTPTDRREIVSEAADLLYALQVFLSLEGISLLEVLKEDISRNQR